MFAGWGRGPRPLALERQADFLTGHSATPASIQAKPPLRLTSMGMHSLQLCSGHLWEVASHVAPCVFGDVEG